MKGSNVSLTDGYSNDSMLENQTSGEPLSFNQEQLWFIHQSKGSVQYHIPIVLNVTGDLEHTVAGQAFKEIMNRHHALRTVIRETNTQPRQYAIDINEWKLRIIDNGSDWSNPDVVQSTISDIILQPFNLDREPMIRATLIPVQKNENILVVTIHHIACDGWSMEIIIREWMECYTSLKNNVPINLPSLELQYSDFAKWQRTYLESSPAQSKIAFWKRTLQGVLPLNLHGDYIRNTANIQGDAVNIKIHRELMHRALMQCKQCNSTPFMFLLAIFKLLLSKYSGQSDICVGVPTAGRLNQTFNGVVGYFANSLPIRTIFDRHLTFAQLLELVRDNSLDAYDNQEIPFDRIVREVMPERELEVAPIFQVMFDFQSTLASQPVQKAGGLNFSPKSFKSSTAKFDITFSALAQPDELTINIEFSANLFNRSSITGFAKHFERLLSILADNPQQKLSELSFLSDDEKKTIVELSDRNSSNVLRKETIIHLLHRRAKIAPDSIAIVSGDEHVTYSALLHMANNFRSILASHHVGAGALVPICMEKSISMLAAIIGILEAGAAYVPIDTKYPQDRIKLIIEDLSSEIFVCSSQVAFDCGSFTENDIVIESSHNQMTDGIFREIQETEIPDFNSVAYIMYTSGSTGKPKGVIISHRNVVSLVQDKQYIDVTPDDVLLSTSSPSFDASTFEFWTTLLNGGRLVLADNTALLDHDVLKKMIRTRKVTRMWFTSSWLNQIADTDITVLAGLKTIIVGGERLSEKHIKKVRESYPAVEIINGYGPTESTTFSTTARIDGVDPARRIPIGKPLRYRSVFVLDEYLNICPIGIPGEIYVSGDGLSTGYLNNPEITSKHFIPSPFSNADHPFIFKTGDIGRLLSDGNIEYLGRADNQVKIRGYRVELEEIEATLKRHRSIVDGVVVLSEIKLSKSLIAYVVVKESYAEKDVIEHLRKSLPEYMIPAHFAVIEKIPLTRNGKVDKRSLPSIRNLAPSRPSQTTNPFEHAMLTIWKELLNRDDIRVNDNFFELGGDSIISIQVVSRIRREGFEMSVIDLFENQTIEALSKVAQSKSAYKFVTEEGVLSGDCGLLPIQEWFFLSGHPEPNHFNQSVLLGISKEVRENVLKNVTDILLAHHDALRFSYHRDADAWKQTYELRAAGLIIENASHIEGEESLNQHIASCAERYQRSFRLNEGDLIKIVLIKTGNHSDVNRLLIIAHHLVIDGVSWRILLEDLNLCLQAVSENGSVSLRRKTTSYRLYYRALMEYAQSDRLKNQIDFWEKITASYKQLPYDINYGGELQFDDIRTVNHELDEQRTNKLIKVVAAKFNCEMSDLLMYSLSKSLCENFGINEIVVGLEGHGRQDNVLKDVDSSHTIGWFTTLYPVLITPVMEDHNLPEGINTVKRQIRDIPDNGLGFGLIHYTLNKKTKHQAFWDVVFNYLGNSDNVVPESKWLRGVEGSSGTNFSHKTIQHAKIIIDCIVQGRRFQFAVRYSQKHFEAATIDQLAEHWLSNLRSLAHESVDSSHLMNVIDSLLLPEFSSSEIDQLYNYIRAEVSKEDVWERVYSLSGLQKGILFNCLYVQQGTPYVEQFSCSLSGIDIQYFIQSWEILFRKHSILRTSFHHKNLKYPIQCVSATCNAPVTLLDLRDLPDSKKGEAMENLRKSDQQKAFDFSVAPLMRITLIQYDDNNHMLLWTFHHLILDGWSQQILITEFFKYYYLLLNQQPLPQVETSYPFEEYIRLIAGSRDDARTFWQTYLHDVTGNTILPFAKTHSRNKGVSEFAEKKVVINNALTSEVVNFSKRNRLTVNTIIQGIWSYLLHKYTGNQNVVFGITLSGRPSELSNIESRVGMFINTLPLNVRIAPDACVIPWLQQIQDDQFRIQKYQYSALSDIQKIAGIEGELFDSILVFQNFPISEIKPLDTYGVQIENIANHEQTTNYPLVLRVGLDNELHIQFVYKPDVIDAQYVTDISQHFTHVLTEFVRRPESALAGIRLMPQTEIDAVFQLSKGKDAPIPAQNVFELYATQARLRPDAVAVSTHDSSLTYSELWSRASCLANELSKRGLSKGDRIGVCLEKDINLIVSILAILKLGCVYVPIDKNYPKGRVTYILNDAGIRAVILSDDRRILFDENTEVKLFFVSDSISSETSFKPEDESFSAALPACIYYTSGSTGSPKGVIVTHRNIVSLVLNADFVTITAQTVILSTGSQSFDATTFEYWGALLNGGHLILISEYDLLETLTLKNQITTRKVDLMWFTSGWLNQIIDSEITLLKPLKTIIAGGEKLSERHITRLVSEIPSMTIINGYGPTENTTFSLTHRITTGSEELPIGRPLNNRYAFVMNKSGQLNPIGVPGEIYVGGAGLTEGYLNEPTLTAGKFIDADINKEKIRLYKTGDMGVISHDGSFYYLGRRDDQIKVRGIRIEIGEIENVLVRCPGVKNAVVIFSKEDGLNGLIAFLMTDPGFDSVAAEKYLKNILPEYMIPSRLITLAQIPLTQNGKVDRKALLAAAARTTSQDNTQKTDIECKLAAIWSDILGVTEIGKEDDFFALGGDSIKIIGLVSLIQRVFNKQLPLADVYNASALNELAALIEATTNVQDSDKGLVGEIEDEIARLKTNVLSRLDAAELIEDVYPMTDIQVGMVYTSLLQKGQGVYHDQIVHSLISNVDSRRFNQALALVASKHSILRTRFHLDFDGGAQLVYKTCDASADVIELSQTTEANVVQTIQNFLTTERQKPFELNGGALWRANILSFKKSCAFIFQFHHSILDGWSVASLMTELNNLYLTLCAGHLPDAKPLKCSYRDFTIESLVARNNIKNLEYWKKRLDGYKRLDVFTPGFEDATLIKTLDPSLFRQIRERIKHEGVTLKSFLAGAWMYTLKMLTYHNEITIGVVTNVRPAREDGEKVLGCFLNSIPFRYHFKQGATWNDIVKDIDLELSEMKKWERTSLFEIRKIIGGESAHENPFFDIIFNFTNFHILDDVRSGLTGEFSEASSQHTGDYKSIATQKTNTFLDINADVTGDNLTVHLTLRRKLKSDKSPDDLMANFEAVVAHYLNCPDAVATHYDILPSSEKQLLYSHFYDTTVDSDAPTTIIDKIQYQCQTKPHQIAVVFEDQHLTYEQLWSRSNELAYSLLENGCQPEVPVPVCIERGLNMITSLLGILNAGAAYVPVDPTLPLERIKYILDDIASPIIMCDERSVVTLGKINLIRRAQFFNVDESKNQSRHAVLRTPSSQAPAYVIYTSGSTGKPKGVIVNHSAVLNRLLWAQAYFNLQSSNVILQKTNFTFDVSVWELFLPLISGAKLIFAVPEGHKEPIYLKQVIEREKITMVHFVPSMLTQFTETLEAGDCAGLVSVICSGEALLPGQVQSARQKLPSSVIYNLYGPTEAAIDVTYFQIADSASDVIPIGKPVSNVHIFILDEHRQLMPAGTIGEIFIGGVQVAQGYVNKIDLTSETFFENSLDAGQRLYRTGDFGQWDANGNIIYHGRIDDQIKLFGNRIELGEIESNLLAMPGITNAKVVAHERDDNKWLVAFLKIGDEQMLTRYVKQFGIDNVSSDVTGDLTSAIKHYLGQKMPAYMVPSTFIPVDEFPVNSSGKADVGILKNLINQVIPAKSLQPPTNPIEEIVLQLWKDILMKDAIGVSDNFFELGGHSLSAMKMVSAINKKWNVELNVKSVFEHSTIEQMARLITVVSARTLQGDVEFSE